MPEVKIIRGIENRKVVSQKAWLAARKKLLPRPAIVVWFAGLTAVVAGIASLLASYPVI